MTKCRTNLPQLNGDMFLTDGGLETTLIYKDGYNFVGMMSEAEAERYHSTQIRTFAETDLPEGAFSILYFPKIKQSVIF